MLSTLCRPLHLIVNHSSSLVKKLFSAFRIPATIYRHEIFECRVQPLIGDLQCIYCYFPLLHLIGSPSLGFPLGSTIFLHFFGSIAIPIFCSLSQPVLCSTVALCPLQWVKDWHKMENRVKYWKYHTSRREEIMFPTVLKESDIHLVKSAAPIVTQTLVNISLWQRRELFCIVLYFKVQLKAFNIKRTSDPSLRPHCTYVSSSNNY